MDRQAVKSDFEAMLRTFGCATVSCRYEGRVFDGLLPFISTERRLMMQGADPSWAGTLYIRRSDVGSQELKSGNTISVKRDEDPGYIEYRVQSPSNYAGAFVSINLASKSRG